MRIDAIILIIFAAAALWTVMTRSLLRSAIGLALTSLILTALMFRLNSGLAAVFELSVCAGLISVLFVSTISLTHPLTMQEVMQHMRERMARFWFLPFFIIALAVILSLAGIRPVVHLPGPETVHDVRVVLWNMRQTDVMGQVIVLLAGVFGVVILFKERLRK